MRELMIWTLVILWLGFWLCVFVSPVHADSDLERLLVRSAIAEADFHPVDRAAIWHVLQRRATRQNKTLEALAQRYVSGLRIHPTPRLLWIMAVDERCEKPAHWDAYTVSINKALDWDETYAPKCRRAFEDVRLFLQGELKDPCGALNWGSPVLPADVRRAASAIAAGKWLPATCASGTANRFFIDR